MPGYISEVSYAGDNTTDFIEIRLPAGTDPSAYTVVEYGGNGTVDGTYSLGSITSTTPGDVYVVDSATAGFNGLNDNHGIALVDDTGTVVQFISFNGFTVTATEGPANGLTSTEIGSSGSGNSLETSDGGSTYAPQSAQNKGTVPCYAPGTMIDTPDGPRAVETLRACDLVSTVYHGPQPIRWVRSGDNPLEKADVEGKPVLIKAGALGAGRPAQDLIVSPQHRILVGGAGQLARYFDTMAFAPAKALTKLPGIRHMKGKAKITWVHFACDRHEVVTANGCQSESLLLGSMVLNGLPRAERNTLAGIFGPVTEPGAAMNGTAALACLNAGEVRRQLANPAPSKLSDATKEIRKWDRDAAMERYEAQRLCASPFMRADNSLANKPQLLGEAG